MAEEHLKNKMPESAEKYEYERGETPVGWLEAIAEQAGEAPIRAREDIIAIVKDELSRAGVSKVSVKVSRFQGRDEEAKYADMTHWERGGKHFINVHPMHLYTPEEDLRAAAWHEAEHILGKR